MSPRLSCEPTAHFTPSTTRASRLAANVAHPGRSTARTFTQAPVRKDPVRLVSEPLCHRGAHLVCVSPDPQLRSAIPHGVHPEGRAEPPVRECSWLTTIRAVRGSASFEMGSTDAAASTAKALARHGAWCCCSSSQAGVSWPLTETTSSATKREPDSGAYTPQGRGLRSRRRACDAGVQPQRSRAATE